MEDEEGVPPTNAATGNKTTYNYTGEDLVQSEVVHVVDVGSVNAALTSVFSGLSVLEPLSPTPLPRSVAVLSVTNAVPEDSENSGKWPFPCLVIRELLSLVEMGLTPQDETESAEVEYV